MFQLFSIEAYEALKEIPQGNWLSEGPIPKIIKLLTKPVVPSHDGAFEHASPPSGDLIKPTSNPHGLTGQKRRRLSNQDEPHPKRQKPLEESHKVADQLSTLPTELILAIFDELFPDHAICLALVSPRLWSIGWSCVEKQLMNAIVPQDFSVGHRPVCDGEDEELEDLALSELALAQILSGNDFDAGQRAHRDDPVDLYNIVHLQYLQTRAREISSRRAVGTPQRIAQHEMCRMPSWILRNLETHEFVRSEVLAGNSEQSGPNFKNVRFTNIILSKNFWSSSLWSAIVKDKSVDDESWTGDCLEITTPDNHTRSILSGVPWKDISEDLMETTQLFRAAEWILDAEIKRVENMMNGRFLAEDLSEDFLDDFLHHARTHDGF